MPDRDLFQRHFRRGWQIASRLMLLAIGGTHGEATHGQASAYLNRPPSTRRTAR